MFFEYYGKNLHLEHSKILIIRLSSLGDVVLTTPVVRSLKGIYPDAKVDFLTSESFSAVYENNPLINDLILYDKSVGINSILQNITQKSYDLVIDLQNNIRSHQITRKLKTKTVRFRKPALNKFLLVKFKVNRFKTIRQIPDMYASSVPGLVLDNAGSEIFLPDPGSLVKQKEPRTVAFCPGAKHFTKMWPEENFAELGRLLLDNEFRVKIIGGKDDKELCAGLTQAIPAAENCCTDDNLFDIIKELRKSAVVVCNDSGLMHVAGAVGVHGLAIFGSTVREFGFYPYKSKNTVLENKSLSCRPCSHFGKAECPKGHFKCMREIEPQKVFQEILSVVDHQ